MMTSTSDTGGYRVRFRPRSDERAERHSPSVPARPETELPTSCPWISRIPDRQLHNGTGSRAPRIATLLTHKEHLRQFLDECVRSLVDMWLCTIQMRCFIQLVPSRSRPFCRLPPLPFFLAALARRKAFSVYPTGVSCSSLS